MYNKWKRKWSWSDYYRRKRNDIYYLDPYNDRIDEILENFWNYRFEKAFRAIWKRNVFVLFGISIRFTFTLVVKIITWIMSLFFQYKTLVFMTNHPMLQKNVFKLICWILFLYSMFSVKLFVSLVKLAFMIMILPRALAVVRVNLFNRR